MISGDRLCCSERGDMVLGLYDLFGRIAHLAQPRCLLLGRAQDDLICLHLPDIKAQWQINQLLKRWRLRRISTNAINDVHPRDSSSSLSFFFLRLTSVPVLGANSDT